MTKLSVLKTEWLKDKEVKEAYGVLKSGNIYKKDVMHYRSNEMSGLLAFVIVVGIIGYAVLKDRGITLKSLLKTGHKVGAVPVVAPDVAAAKVIADVKAEEKK